MIINHSIDDFMVTPSNGRWPDILAERASTAITEEEVATDVVAEATSPQNALHGESTVFPVEVVEDGEGGKGGDVQITNAEFVAAVFNWLPEGAFAAVSSKGGNPSVGGWPAHRADLPTERLPADANNYVSCASFYPSGHCLTEESFLGFSLTVACARLSYAHRYLLHCFTL